MTAPSPLHEGGAMSDRMICTRATKGSDTPGVPCPECGHSDLVHIGVATCPVCELQGLVGSAKHLQSLAQEVWTAPSIWRVCDDQDCALQHTIDPRGVRRHLLVLAYQ